MSRKGTRVRRDGKTAPKPAPRRGPSAWRRWLAAAVMLAGAIAAAWWWWWQRPPASDEGGNRPDVLLVTIDTLRADHLGCYGDRQAATPVVDAIAARGARFVEAIAPVPLTLPSHASILTGVTPLVHGVRDNAGFVLAATRPTLAEAFRGAGYATAAFVSGFPLHRRFGLARGFGTYDDRFPRGDDPVRPPYIERRADDTVRAAVAWLRAQPPAPSAPVFVWLHAFDPHAPYDPPEPFRSRFKDRPYAGEVAFVDEQLGRLLAAWRAARPGREPLIVVTSDHGEGLGEHGEPTHGLFIYDSTIRIPLVMAGPGVAPGRTVNGAVAAIDIAPTLLDLAGRQPMAGVEGRSLRPAIEGGRATDEGVYAESLFGRLAFGWAPLHGWRQRGLMFIDAPRRELYELSRDPKQVANVAGERPAEAERMQRVVNAAVAAAPEPKRSATPRDTGDRLRALGYVTVGATSSPSLQDPKDLAALAVRIENAMANERADPAGSAAEFRTILREDPKNPAARRHLAMALAAGRRYDEAAAELRILLAAGDESLETLTLLGDSLRLAGRPADAMTIFQRAADRHAEAPEAFAGQGKVLTALGQPDRAAQAFEQALQRAPDDPDALEGLADLALARRDLAGARARLDALAARDPGDARIALKRGVLMVQSGEVDDAIAVFRAVLDREPRNPEAALDLAGALAKSGRPAEAIPLFEQAIDAGASGSVAWNGLAMARLETGDRAGAAVALRRSLLANGAQPRIRDLLEKLR